ncbi:hypothetical protein [Ignavibacterium sp.]|uniref:hypothetical protein n=1 Tax=Ignavibacterium sp. TaxID=2651167 RepID=UPI00307CE5CD
MEYIKVIFFLAALIFPLILLFDAKLAEYFKGFIRLFLIVHFTILVILIFKLHHLLRDNFNIPNTVTYLVSAIPFVLFFKKYIGQLRSNESIYLVISLVLLGIAVIIDLLSDGKIFVIPNNYLIEETFRIVGALVWFIYNYLIFVRIKKF